MGTRHPTQRDTNRDQNCSRARSSVLTWATGSFVCVGFEYGEILAAVWGEVEKSARKKKHLEPVFGPEKQAQRLLLVFSRGGTGVLWIGVGGVRPSIQIISES